VATCRWGLPTWGTTEDKDSRAPQGRGNWGNCQQTPWGKGVGTVGWGFSETRPGESRKKKNASLGRTLLGGKVLTEGKGRPNCGSKRTEFVLLSQNRGKKKIHQRSQGATGRGERGREMEL